MLRLVVRVFVRTCYGKICRNFFPLVNRVQELACVMLVLFWGKVNLEALGDCNTAIM